jgi:site-specific DNA-methyltransferase (cytosine-N4-specific)
VTKREPWLRTGLGEAHLGDARHALHALPVSSTKLILSSPPFALDGVLTGRTNETSVADWLLSFLDTFARLLHETGSMVLELGGSWAPGGPCRTTEHLEFIVRACNERGWYLLQEFYWYNPERLVSPDHLVAEDRLRFRESVTPVWWLARSRTSVDVDTRRVLGSQVGQEGAPQNLLRFEDTGHDVLYRKRCMDAGVLPHCDPFPVSFPSFFIELLTVPGDLVLDPFAGSCTTGAAAEFHGRRWVCVEACEALIVSAPFRFT